MLEGRICQGLMLAMLAVFATGCAHQVAFQDIGYQVNEELRTEPLIAVISAAERARVVPVRSIMTGAAHSWDAEPGVMLVQVTEVELPQMFERFKLVEQVHGDDAGYLLYLSVPEYSFANFRATVVTHARLLDGDGTELLDQLYSAEGPSRGGRMLWGGAFAMKSAMRTSSVEAFQEIFEAMRADLIGVLDGLSAGSIETERELNGEAAQATTGH
jgi:hypothetical protein